MEEKYTYSDVIIDPSDPRVEIGAEYYYCDNPSTCLERANKEDVAHLAVLEKVYPDAIGHFFIDDAYSICIIRKKEPSYVERQAKWIADNDVKRGDKVWIVREADSHEDGWDNFWTLGMDETVGKVGTVSDILSRSRGCGIEVDVPDVGPSFYPYFVLEKVEQEYAPYDFGDRDCRTLLVGEVVRYKRDDNEGPTMITGFTKTADGMWKALLGDRNMVDAEAMFEYCVHIDGTPCGVVVEDKEERP